MSLAVQKIDSIRWRIGARCGPWPGSSVRWGRKNVKQNPNRARYSTAALPLEEHRREMAALAADSSEVGVWAEHRSEVLSA